MLNELWPILVLGLWIISSVLFIKNRHSRLWNGAPHTRNELQHFLVSLYLSPSLFLCLSLSIYLSLSQAWSSAFPVSSYLLSCGHYAARIRICLFSWHRIPISWHSIPIRDFLPVLIPIRTVSSSFSCSAKHLSYWLSLRISV